jgi:uncharacterized coiled-coil protein SlyX
MRPNAVAAVLVIAIVVLGGVLGYYYVTSQGTISSQNSTITSQSAAIQADLGTIASDTSKIASLNSTIASDNTQIASLTATLNADMAKISSLTSGYAAANSTISTLQSQISTLNAQVASLTSQVSNLQAQVSQMTSLLSLSTSAQEAVSDSVSVPANANVTVVTFTSQYAGYLLVTLSADSNVNTVGFNVLDEYSTSINRGSYSGVYLGPYGFPSVPNSLVLPVTPGTITVYVVNVGGTSGTATISVTYYS